MPARRLVGMVAGCIVAFLTIWAVVKYKNASTDENNKVIEYKRRLNDSRPHSAAEAGRLGLVWEEAAKIHRPAK